MPPRRRGHARKCLAAVDIGLCFVANLLLNRDFALPSDGFYHLAPLGEFPHAKAGVVQVVDAAAVEAMANRFREVAKSDNFAGLLVDFDHFSLDNDKSSEAAGWITEVQNRADGLWGKIRWSDVGEAAVKGGRYRFISPVWAREDCEEIGNGRVRPARLMNAAVTNDPNLKGITPLSNRLTNADKEKANTMDYRKALMNVLNSAGMAIPEDADDAAIENACGQYGEKMKNAAAEMDKSKEDVKAMQNRATAAEAKVAEYVKADAVRQADADIAALESEGRTIENRDAVRVALLANREPTLAALRSVKPAVAKPDDLPNRRDGKPPAEDAETLANRKAQSDAVAAVINRNKCSAAEAWDIAKAEKPELFK